MTDAANRWKSRLETLAAIVQAVLGLAQLAGLVWRVLAK